MSVKPQQPRPKERILILGEDVDQASVRDIIKSIYDINLDDEEREHVFVDYERLPIHLILNTYGGSVYDGLALIGAIELSETPIIVTCLGSAMSMGLFILSSGHYRRAHHLSTIMYHQLSMGSWDTLEGIAKDMQEGKRLEEVCDNLLFKRTKLKMKDLENFKNRKADWYMSAQEALKYGIIDEIIGAPLISKENIKKIEAELKKSEPKSVVNVKTPATKPRPKRKLAPKKKSPKENIEGKD